MKPSTKKKVMTHTDLLFFQSTIFLFCVLRTNLNSRHTSRFSQKRKEKEKKFYCVNKFDKPHILHPCILSFFLVQICLFKKPCNKLLLYSVFLRLCDHVTLLLFNCLYLGSPQSERFLPCHKDLGTGNNCFLLSPSKDKSRASTYFSQYLYI